ncbi:hypothetical protein B7463_g1567, partial [Scytalidium lignicola]
MLSATLISLEEFRSALQRYPDLISKLTKPSKGGLPTLEELDTFRYVEAPARFSKGSAEFMEREDVMKLVDWKLRHGVFRPTLPKLVASNTNELVKQTLTDAFALYDQPPTKPSAVVKKLSASLKGIGPATASLLLSVYDPTKIVFFSDEAYRWLCAGGNKAAEIKYNFREIDDLFEKSRALMERLQMPALDIERVAYVLMKEDEPLLSKKTDVLMPERNLENTSDEYELDGQTALSDQATAMIDEVHDDLMNIIEEDNPEKSELPLQGSGLEDTLMSPATTSTGVLEEHIEMTVVEKDTLMSPPGDSSAQSSGAIDEEVTQQVAADLSKADEESKVGALKRKAESEDSESPSKKRRGRPPKPATEKEAPAAGTPRKRGRPAGTTTSSSAKKLRGRPKRVPTTATTVAARKPRGRPPKTDSEVTPKRGRPAKAETQSPSKRGRPPKVKEDTETAPAEPKGKRGRPPKDAAPVAKKGRGRPPKSATEEKTEDGGKVSKAPAESEKKPRGRPAKAVTTEEKKPRGRPPQAKKAASSNPAAGVSKTRGRPRKFKIMFSVRKPSGA